MLRMSDTPVLELVRAIRTEIADLRADNIEFRERIGGLELAVVSLSRRVDRVASDVGEIRRRLGLKANG